MKLVKRVVRTKGVLKKDNRQFKRQKKFKVARKIKGAKRSRSLLISATNVNKDDESENNEANGNTDSESENNATIGNSESEKEATNGSTDSDSESENDEVTLEIDQGTKDFSVNYAVEQETPYSYREFRKPFIVDSPASDQGIPVFNIDDFESDTSDDPKTLKIHTPREKQVKRKRNKSITKSVADISFETEVPNPSNIHVFPVRERGLMIVILPHPTVIKFVGTVFIQVISGVIKILGFQMDQSHGILPATSVNNVLCLDIKTVKSNNVCQQVSRLQVVKDALLENAVPEEMADIILNSCNRTSVIVGFRKNMKSSNIHFTSSLMGYPFELNLNKRNDFRPANFKYFGFKIYLETSTDMEYPDCENLVKDVISCIKFSVEKGLPAPRVIAQGAKGVGKSTFLRYLVNTVLNEFSAVYYLDGDLGQSEFTPPGCVSLVKVTEPLLGPPFSHPTTPEKMYFLGNNNVQSVTEMYKSSMKLLSDYYKENCSAIPLFVNTMGFVKGQGLILLGDLKKCVSPTHIVKILENKSGSPQQRSQLLSGTTNCPAKEYIFKQFAPIDEAEGKVSALDRRDLSILSYLGKCLKPYSKICSLNNIEPYCLLWKDTALYVSNKDCADHFLYSFLGSFVALLSVDESMMWESENSSLPLLLGEEPVGCDCLGFGVVASIDKEKKTFHIISPEPEDRLRKVNSLMKGNIILPQVLQSHQNAKEQILYMMATTVKSCIASKKVKKLPHRSRRPQPNY